MRRCNIIFIILIASLIDFNKADAQSISSIVHNQYELENPTALHSFFTKLNNRSTEKVKILHWGDSHVQMGYFSQRIRVMLDSLFGVADFGATFPYKIAGFNPFHSYSKLISGKWKASNIMNDSTTSYVGVTGFGISSTDSIGCIEFGPLDDIKIPHSNLSVTLFVKTDSSILLKYEGYDITLDSNKALLPICISDFSLDQLGPGWKRVALNFKQPINRLRISITNSHRESEFIFHAAFFEDTLKNGVSYSSCGVGGSQLRHITRNSKIPIQEAKYWDTDLFIISFGSNESYYTSFDSSLFALQTSQFLRQIKLINPTASILITGPPDSRSKNRIPINCATICSKLHDIAARDGYAYLDFRTLMGGAGSMATWVKKKLASTDQLHFTKAGYSMHADWLISAIYEAYLNFNKSTK